MELRLKLLLLCFLAASAFQDEAQNVDFIPPDFLSPLHMYPNVLNITDNDRRKFHPVVKFPLVWSDLTTGKLQLVPNYQILDLQMASGVEELASEYERQESRTGRTKPKQHKEGFKIGRYDENRIHLYASDMFDDTSHQIDGYAGQRTVHIGIDLDAPVYTKVYSFCNGIVHSAGYNADLGDYGNVIIVEHDLGKFRNGTERKLWALYGHLDDKSIQGMHAGKRIKRGQFLGRMGDIHENGGWKISHVHFQLSLYPPKTHDMPGVVSVKDRPRALLHYPDPRLVLGPLY
jgi:peptidoglycan LD-endopeptidase LytH